MKRILCDGGTFVDVGANVGLYSCIASKLGGVRVIAVEPSPDSFIRLAHNLYANSAENVELVQTALGHRNSLALLHRPSATNSGSSRVLFHRERLSKGVVVSCISYAELANYVSLDAVRLMKIDIEGNEMTVFDGIDFYAPYAPENIICEFVPSLLPDSVTFEYYLEYFDQRGYRVCDVYGEPILTFRDNLPDSNLWIRRFSN